MPVSAEKSGARLIRMPCRPMTTCQKLTATKAAASAPKSKPNRRRRLPMTSTPSQNISGSVMKLSIADINFSA